MHIAVVEPDGGIRGMMRSWLVLQGYTTYDANKPEDKDYALSDLVIFGPNSYSDHDIPLLDSLGIPHLKFEFFMHIGTLMQQVDMVYRYLQQHVDR